jgi:hypothetical protein
MFYGRWILFIIVGLRSLNIEVIVSVDDAGKNGREGIEAI